MKILSVSNKNNNYYKNSKADSNIFVKNTSSGMGIISFKSGLPESFVRYVEQMDISKVEKRLGDKNIITDFNGVKPVAACSEATVEIMEAYNFPLPQQIIFAPIDNKTILANYRPPGIITINSNIREYNCINEINKLSESQGNFHPTGHFLETFIHEFAHNAHYQNILSKYHYNHDAALSSWDEMIDLKIRPFWTKIQGNGEYSTKNLLEYMAELITKTIALSLDSNLKLKKTPILNIFEDYTTELKVPAPYTNTPSWALNYENRNYVGNKNLIGLVKATNKAIWDGDIMFIRAHGAGIKGQLSLSEISLLGRTIIKIFNH